MARGDQTRSVRKDAPLDAGRADVVLPQSRRFFTASGSNQGQRTARALTDALGLGVDVYADVLEGRNVKGAARAAQEAAAGGERSETDTNKGYNDAFDQVEASNDLAEFASELTCQKIRHRSASTPTSLNSFRASTLTACTARSSLKVSSSRTHSYSTYTAPSNLRSHSRNVG